MVTLVNPTTGVRVEVTAEKATRLQGFVPVDEAAKTPATNAKTAAPARRNRRASEKN